MFKKWFKKLFDILERSLPFFFTFHLRPKKAKNVGIVSDKLLQYPKVAIVIQGPIVYDQDFTLETIKIYKKIFPQAIIILSTWDYEDKEYVGKVRNEIADVLFNKVPEQKGVQNINFQIISSLLGIKHAKTLGVEYVLKTRTDQRIYGVDSLEYLVNIVEKFPTVSGYKQNKRIVGCSLNSFKYRMYGISDMNLFGQIDDLFNYWDVGPADNQGEIYAQKVMYNEVHLAVSFLKKIDHEVKWTLDDSQKVLANCFVIVDEQSLDLYWYKYARMKEYRYVRYDTKRNDQQITFRDWFNLYSNLENRERVDLNKIKKVIP
jgi:hypothetical protein